MSSYVLAASVFYCTTDGRRTRYTRGDVLPALSAQRTAQLLGSGAITAEGERATPAPQPEEPVVVGDAAERPKNAATVEVWRAYAIATGTPEADAAQMTKKQLQEATR